MFEIKIDRDACDGIFACLARDGRFVEDDDGLATIDPDAAGVVRVEQTGGRVVAVLEGDAESDDDATLAARACPPGAISVREVDA
ncbi:ferredoxin [Haloferax volcanii]|uniref:Ferredoxin n=1 Tax=Haloferax volcanii TaxID=2246 RepID=A0A6C0UY24_HALVO|nr:ferredoxin [Haloferax alexandrinus]QIB77878.1 ferredoxin [Haloferax alexandrinus]